MSRSVSGGGGDGGGAEAQHGAAERAQLAEAGTDAWLSREEAFATDSVWVGVLTTAAREMSSWHHHGDYKTYAYVLSGRKRIEYGPGGNEVLEARRGDFIHLPRRLVHREGNPDAEPSELIVFRVGNGPPVMNVDGPSPEVAGLRRPRD